MTDASFVNLVDLIDQGFEQVAEVVPGLVELLGWRSPA